MESLKQVVDVYKDIRSGVVKDTIKPKYLMEMDRGRPACWSECDGGGYCRSGVHQQEREYLSKLRRAVPKSDIHRLDPDRLSLGR